jgi:tetratricopeptide (TPR) repeat protein
MHGAAAIRKRVRNRNPSPCTQKKKNPSTSRCTDTLHPPQGVKDEADALFKKGLFEQAAEVYSTAVGELGDEEDYQHERCLCYNNRAACRLQIRDYAATIADCGEVLCVDGDNVKALVRRAMSYEGLER